MNVALLLSGGNGSRLGSEIPKQYIEVYGKPLIEYSLEVFGKCKKIDAFIIVAAKEWHDYIKQHLHSDKFIGFAEPGETRQLSIYKGLIALNNKLHYNDVIIIHDAARPLVSDGLINRCIDALGDHDGVLPVLAMKDTVYFSDDGKTVASLVQREKLLAGQAPEAFKFGKYFEANKSLLPKKILSINGSTEPAIIYGMDVAVIPGDEQNFKITTINDLMRFEEIMREKQ